MCIRDRGGLFYCVNGGAGTGGLLGEVQVVTEFGVLAAVFHEHARNEHALSLGFDLFFHGASSFGCEKRFFKKYGVS